MADSCRAAVFHAPGVPQQIRTLALPVLGPGELLVRVACCTVCGSDLHTYQGRRPTPTPTVLGHNMRLHPLVLMLWLILWGWMWGVVGVLIAVPLLVCLKLAAARLRLFPHWVKLIESPI